MTQVDPLAKTGRVFWAPFIFRTKPEVDEAQDFVTDLSDGSVDGGVFSRSSAGVT